MKERRVYSDAGSPVPDGKSVYSYGPFSDPTHGASTLTTVDEKDGAGVLLAKSKHYFFETAASPSTVDPVEYPHWRKVANTRPKPTTHRGRRRSGRLGITGSNQLR